MNKLIKEHLIIPKDVAKYARREKRKCVILFSVLMLVAVIVYFTSIAAFENVPLVNKIMYFLILSFAAFVISGFPKKVYDKSWSGVVIETDMHLGFFGNDLFDPVRFKNILKKTVFLRVMLDGGGEEKKEASMISVENKSQIDSYYPGDTVCYIDGTNFAYIIPKNKDSKIKCVMCGAMLPQENDVCDHCGHGLVKYR